MRLFVLILWPNTEICEFCIIVVHFFAIHIALTYPEGSVSLLELFGFDMFSGFAIVFFFAFWNELLQSYKLNPA